MELQRSAVKKPNLGPVPTTHGWRDGSRCCPESFFSSFKVFDHSLNKDMIGTYHKFHARVTRLKEMQSLVWGVHHCWERTVCGISGIFHVKPGAVAHAFSPSTWEAKISGSLGLRTLRPASSTQWDAVQTKQDPINLPKFVPQETPSLTFRFLPQIKWSSLLDCYITRYSQGGGLWIFFWVHTFSI